MGSESCIVQLLFRGESLGFVPSIDCGSLSFARKFVRKMSVTPASPLAARMSRMQSHSFSVRIFEQKRDCSQSMPSTSLHSILAKTCSSLNTLYSTQISLETVIHSLSHPSAELSILSSNFLFHFLSFPFLSFLFFSLLLLNYFC